MPRVIGLHEFELKPGVTEAAFEDAVRAFILVDQSEGVDDGLASLIKSDRGTRRGQYGLLIEFESVETRDSWFTDPPGGLPEPEPQRPKPGKAIGGL